jgi:hypothetical protein
MLGWQQSKVSKIETRKQLTSEDDIAAWAGAVGAPPVVGSSPTRPYYGDWEGIHLASTA